jgi:hypothetical protein
VAAVCAVCKRISLYALASFVLAIDRSYIDWLYILDAIC